MNKTRGKPIRQEARLSTVFYDRMVMQRVLKMWASGVPVLDIANYVGLSDQEVNEIIDTYAPFLP